MKRPPRKLPPVPSFQLVRRFLARQTSECEAFCRWTEPAPPRKLVVVGDLQRTVLAEQLYLGRRQNDAVREALMRAINDEEPDVMLLLGDQVADGASDREWQYFDRLVHDLRERSTAFHALRGNHDYSSFDRARSDANFFSRFTFDRPGEPDLVRFGNVAFVGLDSNFNIIGPQATMRAAEAYKDLLDELDNDPSVNAVVVGSHHPPFSNSKLRSTEPVIELFAKPFLAARKTRLYLSAHVHSYERFEREGKTFIVSGGGGGPRRAVDVSDARRWRDDAYQGSSVRPFHYLRMTITDEAIEMEMMMLAESVRRWQRRWGAAHPKFEVGDAVRIALM